MDVEVFAEGGHGHDDAHRSLGHSQLIVDSELRRASERHHPRPPKFAATGIKVFAENELDEKET